MADKRFSRRISGCTFTDHVRDTKTRTVLPTHALQGTIQDYTEKQHNRIFRINTLTIITRGSGSGTRTELSRSLTGSLTTLT
jgi:hypothetical protein